MSTDIPDNADAQDDEFLDDDGVLYDDEVTPEFGILGFTLRELLIVSVWLVAFIVSFFPLANGVSIWGAGIQWILPIGLPTAAVFLVVLRRFSPEGIRRVGSLGIDQFASVAFSVALVTWLSALWTAVAGALEFGIWVLNWVGVVQLVAMLALVVLTVFAPLVPGLREDFQGRLVTLAHRNANPVRPVIPRPRPEPASEAIVAEPTSVNSSADSFAAASDTTSGTGVAPALAADDRFDDSAVASSRGHATDEVARFDLPEQVPLASHASGGGIGTDDRASSADDDYMPHYSRRSQPDADVSDTGAIRSFFEEASVSDAPADAQPTEVVLDRTDEERDVDATNPRMPAPATQPFWILAPTERDVHDERGEPVFRIGPSAWALVIEDRGGAFVIRHDDGRIGYLHDISDITKG
ncbi:hypothetical protein [Microbacterium sp. 179-I 3D4 NHS]|uniref:hypothetical protein n=1 Tax=Microbacterium sp. 179-I 3D4 NHS TaxID=3142381 RepID=UPI0039A3780F